MNMKKNNNKGFTLIELIIAMAILAMLMTSVCSLMGIGVFNYKKVKADVSLQSAAQDTYTRLNDSIMQSTDIVIEAWTSTNPLTFSESGASVSDTVTLKYYVLNDDIKTDFVAHPELYGIHPINGTVSSGDVALFSTLDPTKEIYVTALGVRRAANIDESMVSTINGTTVKTAEEQFSGSSQNITLTNSSGEYIVKDTVVDSFVFRDENMYYGIQHRFMDSADDILDTSSDDSLDKHVYTKALSYVKVTAGSNEISIPGVKFKVDANSNSIEMSMVFNDKKATFTSDGKTSPRNSHVLKNKKVPSGDTLVPVTPSSEETSENSSETSTEASSESE